MYAVAEIEGFFSLGNVLKKEGSRSWRHHNPCNLRKSIFEVANVDNFSVFRTDEEGFFAFQYDVRCKAQGKTSTGLTGESTLRDLIFVYAPASDNNVPLRYLATVCQKTGFSPDMRLKEFLK